MNSRSSLKVTEQIMQLVKYCTFVIECNFVNYKEIRDGD